MIALLILIPLIVYLLIGVFFASAVSEMLTTQVDKLHKGAYILTLAATVLLWPVGLTRKR